MMGGKLEEAQKVLKAINEENEALFLNAQQYLAYIYFEQQNYKASIPIFKQLIGNNYQDKEKMQWCLALSYLITAQAEKGQELINQIAKDTNDKNIKERATILKAKLKLE